MMMPLIFVSSALSSHRIEAMGGSAVVSTAARIFLRLLIAEFYALFLFWHCFFIFLFVVCYFVCGETGRPNLTADAGLASIFFRVAWFSGGSFAHPFITIYATVRESEHG
jgi:hypothetical protein